MQLLKREHEAALERLRQGHEAELEALRERQRSGMAALRGHTQELVAQIKQAAGAEVQRGMAALERQAQDQLRILDQLEKRLHMLEAQSKRIVKERECEAEDPGVGGGAALGSAPQKRYVAAIKEAERELTLLR